MKSKFGGERVWWEKRARKRARERVHEELSGRERGRARGEGRSRDDREVNERKTRGGGAVKNGKLKISESVRLVKWSD